MSKAPPPSIHLADHTLSEEFLQLQKPSVPRAILWAAIWLFVFTLIHQRWLSPLPPFEQISGFDNLDALRLKFFESGWIPYAISLSFLIGLHYLWQIFKKLLLPLSVANQVDLPVIAAARSNDPNTLVELLNNKIRAGHLGYYSKRFAKLLERWERDKDTGAVIALKNEIIESDEENIALAFTAISWVEWTLPLLGFLGTVVGIGGAIGSVKNGVSLLFARERLDPDVLGLFTEGFKGLALAFDTTFQGLAFLIAVGGLHFLLRKNLASNLAAARQLFSEFVAKWFAVDTNPVVIAVGDLGLNIALLESRIDELKETVEAGDRSAKLFREYVREGVERVVAEAPNLDWVRKVLFAPVVEFNRVWLKLAEQSAKTINAKLGHKKWKFTSLGVAASGSHRFVAAVEDLNKPDAHWLFFSDLDAEEAGEQDSGRVGELFPIKLQVRAVFPSSDPKRLFAETPDGRLALVSAGNSARERVIAEGLQVEDALFPLTLEKEDLLLIVRRTPSGFDISYSDFASGGKSKWVHQIPGGTSNALWTFHPQSAQMLAAIQREGRWRLYPLKFSRPSAEPQDGKTQRQEPAELDCQREERDLPPRLTPKQILALSADETLIIDDGGNLHYWHKSRSVPVQLRHSSWPLDPNVRLLAGANGWVAVIAHGHITMWRIQHGGHLHPYENLPNGFAISGVDVSSMIPTWDGRYLLAAGEQLISTWEFPRYVLDG